MVDNSVFKHPPKYHDGPSDAMQALADVCYQWGGVPIDAPTFYREIFPRGTIQPRLHYDDSHTLIGQEHEPTGREGNPIMVIQRGKYLYPGDTAPRWCRDIGIVDPLTYPEGRYVSRVTHRTLYDDLAIDQWQDVSDAKHVWCSGLTYLGKRATLASAIDMRAMIIDLDYITPTELNRFLWACDNKDLLTYPRPQYITITGNGIHLYFTFWEPVPLYHGTYGRKVKKQLNVLKHALTQLLWNPLTVSDARGKEPQYQSIAQPFRMVGTWTKALTLEHDRYRVVGVKFPSLEPFDGLADLYRHIDSIGPVEIAPEDRYRERSLFGIEHWQEKNPDWYRRRIVQKDPEHKPWPDQNRRLYEWWRDKVMIHQITYGHRYYGLLCLAWYAVKCGISEDELRADIEQLRPWLDGLQSDHPMGDDDIESALKGYSPEGRTVPFKVIKQLAAIHHVPKMRRNGRSRADHLRGARLLEELHHPNWRKGNGRKDKREKVLKWCESHPEGKKADCVRDTGLTKPTVYKWWPKTDT